MNKIVKIIFTFYLVILEILSVWSTTRFIIEVVKFQAEIILKIFVIIFIIPLGFFAMCMIVYVFVEMWGL